MGRYMLIGAVPFCACVRVCVEWGFETIRKCLMVGYLSSVKMVAYVQ
jgi:hypothetical protein